MSSNRYLSRLKRKYNTKKAGFSGTLDPFAKGVLIIAFGTHAKLFRFLKKTPKTYEATLWLGVNSPSLDNENIDSINVIPPYLENKVQNAVESLHGDISYYPPKFCAKKINGKRAYELARAGEEVVLKEITSTVHDVKLLNYSHPFVTFSMTISEGGYIRSMAHLIAQKLNCEGTLCMLERKNEGAFYYEDEKALKIEHYLDLTQNHYFGDIDNLRFGRKLTFNECKIQKNGRYYIKYEAKLAIIEINDLKVNYLLNGVSTDTNDNT